MAKFQAGCGDLLIVQFKNPCSNLLFATSSQLLTCGGLAVLGFVGIFVYKLCKKEREDEGGDMDYSVAVTNSLFREERSDTVSIVHPPKKLHRSHLNSFPNKGRASLSK